jgi:hypothetical protein
MFKKICLLALLLVLAAPSAVLAGSTTSWPAGSQQFPQSLTRESGITVELTPVAARVLEPTLTAEPVHAASPAVVATESPLAQLFGSRLALTALLLCALAAAAFSLHRFVQTEHQIQAKAHKILG